ncbi:MAG: glycogen synthase, partial [Acholeplasmataceae bacterium]|nr:glycogen synthase [Acholeplasmataceae bacterium]
MNVLHVSSECYPFVKVGGLADVVGSLPLEIKRLRNVDVRVALPLYKTIIDRYQDQLEDLLNFTIDLGAKKNVYVGVKTLKFKGVDFYFIDNLLLFGSREQVYDYGDEAERFAFFQLAVLESLSRIPFQPDIIHVHDWHTAMIPLLLKTKYSGTLKAKSVLTIHNLAYQGVFPLSEVSAFGIDSNPAYEFEGFLNYLKSGIVSSDLVTTVSETYAREILTDYYGYGLQRLLRSRGKQFIGILNGISYHDFNPSTDKLIRHNYDIETYQDGKQKNKAALQDLTGFEFPLDKPLLALVSRLVSQKGMDLIKRIFDEMLAIDDFYFIVLGSGEVEYQDYFLGLMGRFPERVFVKIGYDDKLAHQIYAASDMFLMPSKFEPCGLSQMISLRYGTIPIVRETGGLIDTVQ